MAQKFLYLVDHFESSFPVQNMEGFGMLLQKMMMSALI
jgi:hypothetical protein